MARPIVRRVLRWLGWALLALAAYVGFSLWRNWESVQRIFLGGVKVYETVPPQLPADLPRPAVLVFSKTNGYRHEEAIPAANALFAQVAKEKGWGYFQTENGAIFRPDILSHFDAVVFNNVSGDVFTPDQRAAFKAFVEAGGGFVGIHGAGGDVKYPWKWYVDSVIGVQFVGHPLDPQFQKATVRIADRDHPATATLPETLERTDEWYSFAASPRGKPGFTVLATLDEATYKPGSFIGSSLSMGNDHPIVWWHCLGKGRVLYSAMGHTAQSYAEPEYRRLLSGGLEWTMKREGEACGTRPVQTGETNK